MTPIHLITCEYPPVVGGVSEHSRVLADAAAAAGYDVHVWTGSGRASDSGAVANGLGDFSVRALTRAGAALDAWPAPRRLVVQWVPHGYGRKGLNVAFSRWIQRRARAGDRIDLIVHEPFLDFIGPSWRQTVAAIVQRYMTWTVVRAAERVWITIPAWEQRVRLARRPGQMSLHTLPVPGTIPPVRRPEAVAALRQTLLNGRDRLIGYFGAESPYQLHALEAALREDALQTADAAFVCIGRGSDAMAARLRASPAAVTLPITGTGVLAADAVSLHLQACDALMQPYPDGVSGRRTTTISALEHGVPVAATFGTLSEPFWRETAAVECVPATSPERLASAVARLLEPSRNASARAAALALYDTRFHPARTLRALFQDRPESGFRN